MTWPNAARNTRTFGTAQRIVAAERLPREGKRVVFYSRSTNEVYVGVRWGRRWFDEQDRRTDGRAVEVDAVTHWMPFPHPPIAR